MNHPFAELRPEYEHLLSIMKATKAPLVEQVARKLVGFKDRYKWVSDRTGVPIAVLATLHERESTANFHTYLGNGEPLNRVTRLVPKGRGPFADPQAWEKGAIDAIGLDGLAVNSAPWSMPYACWKGEAWNGFGPRNHGRHTGYLWSGTNIYTGGKYVADGVWNPDFQDPQLGIVPVMLRMGTLDPSLQLTGVLAAVVAPSIVPAPAPAPVGVTGALEIQQALNIIGNYSLVEDGNYGRRTRNVIRDFQLKHGLTTDGLVGPKTAAALEKALLDAKKMQQMPSAKTHD